MVGTLSATGANYIGNATDALSVENILAHAGLGCASAAATKQDCWSGALGGATSALELLGNNWRGRYSTQMRGQQAVGSNIAGSDFFSIGTRYTVRGFDGQRTLNAENGWYWRNELALGVLPGVEIYAGLDSGAVAGPSTALLVGTKLTGSVVGVRWNPWSYLSLEGFIGMPIEFPDMPNGGSFISSRYNPGFNLYVQY